LIGPLKIALAQLNLLVGDVEGNTERIIATAIRARDELRARLVVFPELAVTGYPPEDLLLRPDFLRRVEEATARIRTQIRGIAVLLGFPANDGHRTFNAAAMFDDGRELARYNKRLLPNYSVFDEKRYFSAGQDPCVVDCEGHHIGITICEDIWEPEPVASTVQAGAGLVININASPYHIDRADERLEVVCERARANGVPICYLNVVGGQDELVFDGASFVVNDRGQLTQRGPHFDEAIVQVTISGSGEPEPAEIVPAEPLEQSVYRALLTGVHDYVNKNGFPGAIVGLSGGVDSALTHAIAVDALGPERVTAVMMPSHFSAAMSMEDALAQVSVLGTAHHVISIEPLYQAFTKQLAPVFAGRPEDVTEENIQARCRGVLLMALSNKTGAIVLTTGNKSEMAVGYATLYGDMAGGFAVLKDVFKTLVYRLARYRNGISPVIPQRVLTRPPSAELRADQKDTDSLPPYEVLDPILERYVEQDWSPDEIIAQGHNRNTVFRIARMVDKNEYKRRQAPPGVRITRRAFGRDRRYPITSGYRFR